MAFLRYSAFALALAGCLALAACGSDDEQAAASDMSMSGLAVNGYLWRAALDTLSFMPMIDVDPRSGAIITDWYTNPETPRERMKVAVFIIGRELRADALKVNVIREERNEAGVWVNRPVRAGTQLRIEDAILTRARQLRIDTLEK
ncbi:MAG: DUF3576 domain-containing protein [Rhodothalassiaceae bacterium]